MSTRHSLYADADTFSSEKYHLYQFERRVEFWSDFCTQGSTSKVDDLATPVGNRNPTCISFNKVTFNIFKILANVYFYLRKCRRNFLR